MPFQRWLMDNVYAVRAAVIQQLSALIKVFGAGWTKSTLVPQIVTLGSEKAYLARLTTLFVVNVRHKAVNLLLCLLLFMAPFSFSALAGAPCVAHPICLLFLTFNVLVSRFSFLVSRFSFLVSRFSVLFFF